MEAHFMAIRVSTSDPTSLLAAIKKAIDAKHVDTWSHDSDGDFTHTPSQWSRKAWLRPKIQPGTLVLNILGPKGVKLSKEIYGVYHGRFIEMLLAHFDDKFTVADASAALAVGDMVSA
jgi:hypothetical protein